MSRTRVEVADLPDLLQAFARAGEVIDVKSRRIGGAGDGVHSSDLVTVRQLDFAVSQFVEKVKSSPAGGALVIGEGLLRIALYAARGSSIANPATIFIASDKNYVAWVSTGSAWQYLCGVDGGTLSPDQKPTLTTADAGYRYWATDFHREYRWSGSAWADSPGGEARGQIVYFPASLHADFIPSTGWRLCDGTASVTRSTPTGGTTTFTVPNLTGSSRFLRSVAGATGGVGGSATTHTHQVDPPSTTTGLPSLTDAVQSGSGAGEANQYHTHTVDIAAFTSAAPSGVSGDDALPPYYDARPYIRL